MAEVDLTIAGRPYQVACRNGEEETLRAAARAGRRQEPRGAGRARHAVAKRASCCSPSLLLADQIARRARLEAAAAAPPDPQLAERAERAGRAGSKRSPTRLENEARRRLDRRRRVLPGTSFTKIPEAINDPKGAVPARATLVPSGSGSTRRPPDVLASEDFRANGHGGPVTSLPRADQGDACARGRDRRPQGLCRRRSATPTGRCSSSELARASDRGLRRTPRSSAAMPRWAARSARCWRWRRRARSARSSLSPRSPIPPSRSASSPATRSSRGPFGILQPRLDRARRSSPT